MSVRVWVTLTTVAAELDGELSLTLEADGRNVGLRLFGLTVGSRVGLLVFRVGSGEGLPVLGDGVALVGDCVEGIVVLGDGVGLLEYPLVTAPRARKVASIFP